MTAKTKQMTEVMARLPDTGYDPDVTFAISGGSTLFCSEAKEVCMGEDDLDQGYEYGPNALTDTTKVKILPYRPTNRLISVIFNLIRNVTDLY